MSYFPMFVEIKNCPCLVVGGGAVAFRKIEVLREFGAKVTVVSPEIMQSIKEMEDIFCKERAFQLSDIHNMKLVVATTGDKALNHMIAEACKEQKIPVNIVDQIEDCSFIFPSYLKQGEVVAAFGSGGQSPVITQYLKEQARPFMTKDLGELAESMGAIRQIVKETVPFEKRRECYQEILDLWVDENKVPSQEEMARILTKSR
ncbi:MAG: bifunctional precorrin-2 dehydrogenase/sirohydrochlorin ferrochelatase [Dorea sp.]